MYCGEEMLTETQEPPYQNVASGQGMVMSCKRGPQREAQKLVLHLHILGPPAPAR